MAVYSFQQALTKYNKYNRQATASSVTNATMPCNHQFAYKAWGLWTKPSMRKYQKTWPPVPINPTNPGHGSDHDNGGARGAKNYRLN